MRGEDTGEKKGGRGGKEKKRGEGEEKKETVFIG